MTLIRPGVRRRPRSLLARLLAEPDGPGVGWTALIHLRETPGGDVVTKLFLRHGRSCWKVRGDVLPVYRQSSDSVINAAYTALDGDRVWRVPADRVPADLRTESGEAIRKVLAALSTLNEERIKKCLT